MNVQCHTQECAMSHFDCAKSHIQVYDITYSNVWHGAFEVWNDAFRTLHVHTCDMTRSWVEWLICMRFYLKSFCLFFTVSRLLSLSTSLSISLTLDLSVFLSSALSLSIHLSLYRFKSLPPTATPATLQGTMCPRWQGPSISLSLSLFPYLTFLFVLLFPLCLSLSLTLSPSLLSLPPSLSPCLPACLSPPSLSLCSSLSFSPEHTH